MAKTSALSLHNADQGARVADFVELAKPRVMSLVVFTGAVGLVVAPGSIHPLLGAVAILCIALAAGGSAAVNMWYDRDIDAIMTRTRRRPLPQGRVEPAAALEFGCGLIFAAVFLMALAVNLLAALLLGVAAGFYIFVYTIWLKRRTPANIVIGGAAGAFPPLIGWVAVTGRVDLPAVLLFLIIFLWTPPHFWSLALYRNDDYRRAGIPMLPVTHGERRTKIEMLAYTLILVPVTLMPGFAGGLYLAGATLLGLGFIVAAIRVLRDPSHKSARRMFVYSIIYLSSLFTLMLADHWAAGWLS
jgi:protoheme IX farnesyltransferase